MRFYLNQLAPSSDSFAFHSLRNPNVSEALVIHNPPHVICESPTLIRSTKTIEDHISYIKEQQIDKAIIVAEDIGFLRQCSSLEYLWIIPALSAEMIDYSPLYDLPHIQWLRCEIPNGNNAGTMLDCGRMSNLNCLSVSGWNADLNICKANKLKTLYLDSGRPEESSLSVLQPGCAVHNLVVQNSCMTSLSGVEHAHQLRRFELHYNRKLHDIANLFNVRETLTWLDIDNCNGITDFSVLPELRKLELLRLSGTKSLPSLDFIKKMTNLKCLVVTMNVLDGDISCCSDVPYVSIRNRKHFSHKDKDFTKEAYFPFSITAYE